MQTSERRPLAEDVVAPRGQRRRRSWVAPTTILVVLGLVAGAGLFVWNKLQAELFSASCTATAAGMSESFGPDQTANAALIAAISEKRGLPPRAATIAIATALQESKLRNISYGDRDSVGLFQQRPSQGWGSREHLMDPAYATNKFYDALVQVSGYETMEITKVAQRVQRSAYPEAYADHEQQGRVLASTLRGQSPAGLVCLLAPATSVVPASRVVEDLATDLGVTGTATSGDTISVTAPSAELAWAAGQWAVARAEAYGVDRVQVADQAWTRGTGGGSSAWSTGEASAGPTTVSIRLARP